MFDLLQFSKTLFTIDSTIPFKTNKREYASWHESVNNAQLCLYSCTMNSFDVNIHTKWIPLTVVSIFKQNELLWLLCQYSHKMNFFDYCVNIHTKWNPLIVVSIFTQNEFLWLLCHYSHKMNSFDCCVNIHTNWIILTAVSVFTQNEFLWLLCQYSHQMNSFECCANIHTKWIPLTVVPISTPNEFCYQDSHQMNCFDCCVNIHTKSIALTVVSIFTPNEFLWLLCQYSHQMNSFSCQTEHLRTQPCRFTLYQRRPETIGSEFDTFAPYSGLVHDVTDTDCWAQNGSTHKHIFATFKCRVLTNRARNGVKNGYMCIFSFHSNRKGKWRVFGSDPL